MADDFKYHIDHHASLVVPSELRRARERYEAGTASADDVDAAVEAAIEDWLLRERRLGLLALSDGEFRRRNSLSVVYDAISGFGPVEHQSALAELVGPSHAPEVRSVTGELSVSGRLAAAEGAQLTGIDYRSTMVALPSPGFVTGLAGAAAEAGRTLADIIRAEITAFAGEGVVYVLLRNPALAFLLTDEGRERAVSLGIDPDKTVAGLVEADNAVLDGLELPENFCLGLDLTTAGQAAGPWSEEAVAGFLAIQAYERLCVDYPDESRFPLSLVPEGVVMSLGVVDISTPELEDVDALVARIDEAAEIIDIDDIAISTNGGFHLVPELSGETEQAKLQLVEMVARYFWGNEL
ncbi:MAG: methionine synthase [Actinomycetota bacterium]|nr:methionine synthase [Actinomycetota bacterium]